LTFWQAVTVIHALQPTANPQLNLEESPFYINTELQPWHLDEIPRRAGVSSFGIGGTNVHLVPEEAAGGN